MHRVYTSNLSASAETIISRNLYLVLAGLFPGALLSHRNALEGQPVRPEKSLDLDIAALFPHFNRASLLRISLHASPRTLLAFIASCFRSRLPPQM